MTERTLSQVVTEDGETVPCQRAGVDPERWLRLESDPARARRRAARLCAGCPEPASCLRRALDSGEDIGVRGGLPAADRQALRRLLDAS